MRSEARLLGLVEVGLPCLTKSGKVGQPVRAVQWSARDDLGMIWAVVDARVDRLLQVTGPWLRQVVATGDRALERLGADADISTMAVASRDRDALLLLRRQGEELPHCVEQLGFGG